MHNYPTTPINEKEQSILDALADQGISPADIEFQTVDGPHDAQRLLRYQYWDRLPVTVMASIDNFDDMLDEDSFHDEDCGWKYAYVIL